MKKDSNSLKQSEAQSKGRKSGVVVERKPQDVMAELVARLAEQLDVTIVPAVEETKTICAEYGAKRIDMQSATYRNPSSAINAGLKEASGDVIIIQNAECLHVSPNSIERLALSCTSENA